MCGFSDRKFWSKWDDLGVCENDPYLVTNEYEKCIERRNEGG